MAQHDKSFIKAHTVNADHVIECTGDMIVDHLPEVVWKNPALINTDDNIEVMDRNIKFPFIKTPDGKYFPCQSTSGKFSDITKKEVAFFAANMANRLGQDIREAKAKIELENYGERYFVNLQFNDTIKDPMGLDIALSMFLTNGITRQQSLVVSMGYIRIICYNGLIDVAGEENTLKNKAYHRGYDPHNLIDNIIRSFKVRDNINYYKHLYDTPLNFDKLIDFLDRPKDILGKEKETIQEDWNHRIGKRLVDKVLASSLMPKEIPGTTELENCYDLFNIMTWHLNDSNKMMQKHGATAFKLSREVALLAR